MGKLILTMTTLQYFLSLNSNNLTLIDKSTALTLPV